MAIEEAIRSALTDAPAVAALVADRVFAAVIQPETTPRPWLSYEVESEEVDERLTTHTTCRAELVVDVFASTYAEARDLKNEVRRALHGHRAGDVRRVLWQRADYSRTEDGHGYTVRFTCWFDLTD